jgi:hypothetical protein
MDQPAPTLLFVLNKLSASVVKKKANNKQPVWTVRKGSVAIPIYRADTRAASGKLYRAFIAYYYDEFGDRIGIKSSDLEKLKTQASAKAELMSKGEMAQVTLTSQQATAHQRASAICKPLGKTVEQVCTEYAESFLMLRPGDTIKHCVEDYYRRHKGNFLPATMSELLPVFLERKEALKTDLSEIHLEILGQRLKRAALYFQCPIHAITVKDFENFLIQLRDQRTKKLCGAQTRLNYIGALSNFFNSKTAREHLPKDWNELAELDRPEIPEAEFEYFNVREMTILLYGAEGHLELPTPEAKAIAAKNKQTILPPTSEEKEKLREIVPYLAIGMFGSTRNDVSRGEISKLDWGKIKDNYLRMTGGIAKIGRRFIQISEPLQHWLAPYVKESGPVIPNHIRGTRELLCRLTGIKWKYNGLRRGCLTHDRALTGNSEQVSERAGNSARIVKKRYTEPLTKEDGMAWLNIRRPDSKNIVSLPSREMRAATQ